MSICDVLFGSTKKKTVTRYDIWIEKLEKLLMEKMTQDLHTRTNYLFTGLKLNNVYLYRKDNTIIWNHLLTGNYKKPNNLYTLYRDLDRANLVMSVDINKHKIIKYLCSKINMSCYSKWAYHLSLAIDSYGPGKKLFYRSETEKLISIVEDERINGLVGKAIVHEPDQSIRGSPALLGEPNTKREIYIAIYTLKTRKIKGLYRDGYLHINCDG